MKWAPLALTVEGGYNETLLSPQNSWRVAGGLSLLSWPHPPNYSGEASPEPVEIPRVKYEVVVGESSAASGPVANAGPSRTGVAPGVVTLDGSASLRATRYQWTEVSSNSASISNATTAIASFVAKASTNYTFQLEVWDARGFSNTARLTISTAGQPTVSSFIAQPSNITAGQQALLQWQTSGAETVTLQSSAGSGSLVLLGTIATSGSMSVSPKVTTTYTLTATLGSSSTIASVTVTVGVAKPVITDFSAEPGTVVGGGSTQLRWTTQNAKTVTLNGASVANDGDQTVSLKATTTFTLVAGDGNPADNVTATVTVQVSQSKPPLILRFGASEPVIFSGDLDQLFWAVEGADSVTISGIGKVSSSGTKPISINATTVYTLTAQNAGGTTTATVTVRLL